MGAKGRGEYSANVRKPELNGSECSHPVLFQAFSLPGIGSRDFPGRFAPGCDATGL